MKKDSSPILEVNHLSVKFAMSGGDVLAVRDVSFKLHRGRTMGFVGESGCGKSVTAYSILRLVPPPGVIHSGNIMYDGRDIVRMEEDEIRKIRGKEIAMIFQEPMTSLNPVFTVGYQIAESIMLHLGKSRREADEYAAELLNSVGIPDAAKRLRSYPHELSGGMRQRAMIAMALSTSPSILIADEPTTALDVTIQAQILDLLLKLQEERKMSLLLITHDLGIVANIADEIAIMYAGEIVEYGRTPDVFRKPGHPYTRGLFRAIPRIGGKQKELQTIPGMVPTMTAAPTGCVFLPRCYMSIQKCGFAPVALPAPGRGRAVRCVRYRP
ncbi:MAG TPA: ABC transporter ATP-binding protein [Spirochaetota bacterium]|nr:ABC transporter ATP-binding protein [Spirochaetota bacterium]HPG50172.1 ABC transporter ATP-binding protein [Spirochaetota bacterium]HPN13394.1 ABC transporter ATP-binding protein [Spirochaetota bacterium]